MNLLSMYAAIYLEAKNGDDNQSSQILEKNILENRMDLVMRNTNKQTYIYNYKIIILIFFSLGITEEINGNSQSKKIKKLLFFFHIFSFFVFQK